jgi:predicted nucleotidyltransferase
VYVLEKFGFILASKMMIKKSKIEIAVKNYLKQYEDIEFALIFGSYASGKTGNKSDLDVGIFCIESVDLILLGKMIVDLEKITNLKIDLIELKNLYNKSPLLAYQIVTNHKKLFSRDSEIFIDFKRRTFLYYFDTERLRKSVNSTFFKRISSKKIGERNYA